MPCSPQPLNSRRHAAACAISFLLLITLAAIVRGNTETAKAADQAVDSAGWDWWREKSRTDRHFSKGTKVWTQVGTQPIATTADAGASEQFGIVVGNVPTFFIDDAAILVHDATAVK